MTEFLDLVDYLLIAEAVTGIDAKVLSKLESLSLADSALHAPEAGFGDVDFYPLFEQKAAVLLEHLLWNHPLPDGNKRAAWVSMREFIARNGYEWQPSPVDEAEQVVLSVATKDMDSVQLIDWIRDHIKT